MKISACIIAKNEEELLPQCLQSICGLCDEIILVDTGSTDRTIEIAEQFGCDIVKTKWREDFSYHRNQAFDHATGDWLFVIDCDEKLVTENLDPAEFKWRLGKIPEKVTQLVVTVSEPDRGTLASWPGVRFFRAGARPRYKGYVHNKVECPGLAAATDVEMIHYGYHLSPDKMKAKRARTERLLLKRIEDDPEDFNAHYYLCQMAQGDNDLDASIAHGRKCMELLPFKTGDEMQFYATLYFWVAGSYMKKGDAGNTLAWLEKGLEFFPDDLDLNFLMVVFAYKTDNRELAVRHGRRFFKARRKLLNKKEKNPEVFETYIERKDFATHTSFCMGEAHRRDVLRLVWRTCRATKKT